LDRLLGRDRDRGESRWSPGRYQAPPRAGGGRAAPGSDQAAIERYRYLLRTAPPEAVEQAHAEAFARLTPEQRRQVLAEVGAEVPAAERARSDDPASLARMATRAEMRQPGTMERILGRQGGMGGGGIGLGGVIAGSLLASVAGAFVGTAIAEQFFDEPNADSAGADEQAAADSGDAAGADAAGADAAGADAGGADPGGGDFGGGDFGGDFGGGDFGF
jgi:hypothetical protein